jgi:hypothetical protein
VFTYVDFSEVVGGATAATERLPDAPGVYAFFRKIWISPESPVEQFLASIETAISSRAAPDRQSRVGPMHRVTLECRSELSKKKVDDLAALAVSREFRAFLARVLQTGSLLQAPLYVGKADSLQGRIRQHLEPMSDLSVRLRDADIILSRCILAYALVAETPGKLDEDALFLIEELMTRICRPGFVSRIG